MKHQIQLEEMVSEAPPCGDILLFPRKLLRLGKIVSSRLNPECWFIEDRLSQRTKGLELPTQKSHLGLTSGFRSCIIKENDGSYVKFKGVSNKINPKVKISKDGSEVTFNYKGSCNLSEAVKEIRNSYVLFAGNYPFKTLKPLFIETHLSTEGTSKIRQLMDILEFKLKVRKLDLRGASGSIKCIESIYKASELFIKYSKPIELNPDFRFIFASQIRGDTRLDETVYHLTKKDISGKKRTERDAILESLFFKAGVAKGFLAIGGYCWSNSLENTNTHIGNFVLFPESGIINVGICDLGILKHMKDFGEQNEFLGFSKEEVLSFKDDIENKSTISTTIPLPYRNFPKHLRERCFNSIVTGYNLVINNFGKKELKIERTKYAPQMPPKIFMNLNERDFRERLSYLLS